MATIFFCKIENITKVVIRAFLIYILKSFKELDNQKITLICGKEKIKPTNYLNKPSER